MFSTIIGTARRVFLVAAFLAFGFTAGTYAHQAHAVAGTPWIGTQAESMMHAAAQLRPGAPCATPQGSLPSGDAARSGGREYVCTDGAWIPVTGYGVQATTLTADVTGGPAQEAAACADVEHYHHAGVLGWMDGTWTQQQAWQAAWHHAWHEALAAGPEMRADIHRYLFADTGWSLVRYDCNPDEGL